MPASKDPQAYSLITAQREEARRFLAMHEQERRLAVLAIERGLQLLTGLDAAAIHLRDHVARLQLALRGKARRIHVGHKDALRAARHADLVRVVRRERLNAHPVLPLTALRRRR